MGVTNYRDLSVSGNDVGAGFQFEFYCAHCPQTRRTTFRPYRRGQLAALLGSFAFLFSGQVGNANRSTAVVASMGARGARESALADALAEAAPNYRVCPRCQETVCRASCWDEDEGQCNRCVKQLRNPGTDGAQGDYGAAAQAGPNCPNCSTVSSGRFCPECGFDMATTHKTCPACGTMQSRQSRFCTDCGHSF